MKNCWKNKRRQNFVGRKDPFRLTKENRTWERFISWELEKFKPKTEIVGNTIWKIRIFLE